MMMAKTLAVLFGVLLSAGCQLGKENSSSLEREPSQAELHFVVDDSGSLPAESFEPIPAQASALAGAWAERAAPGERLSLWWLTDADSPYPAERIVIIMPPLTVPAHLHRAQAVRDIMDQVQAALSDFPRGLGRTRLLEALHMISSTRDRPWSVWLFSDLQQESSELHLLQRMAEVEREEVLRGMLDLCPSPEVRPTEVVIASWPGLLEGNRAAIHEHSQLREVFRGFLEQWAPEANIRIISIN